MDNNYPATTFIPVKVQGLKTLNYSINTASCTLDKVYTHGYPNIPFCNTYILAGTPPSFTRRRRLQLTKVCYSYETPFLIWEFPPPRLQRVIITALRFGETILDFWEWEIRKIINNEFLGAWCNKIYLNLIYRISASRKDTAIPRTRVPTSNALMSRIHYLVALWNYS